MRLHPNLIKISTCFQSHTFLVQNIEGTGFPDALHSSVMVPPLRAVSWPVCGTARMLGGTVDNGRDRNGQSEILKEWGRAWHLNENYVMRIWRFDVCWQLATRGCYGPCMYGLLIRKHVSEMYSASAFCFCTIL